MILYYSGTGNSKYVAKKISSITNDEIVNLNEKIKRNETLPIQNTKRVIFVTPTYAWRIPRILKKWIEAVTFEKGVSVYFVLTCGDEIGNADKYNKSLGNKKGLNYMGTGEVIMPENYIAMFEVPSIEKSKLIIDDAQSSIDKIARAILNDEKISKEKICFVDRLKSDIVNPVFYFKYVNSKTYYYTDKCIGCGKCVELCPVNNIKLVNDKPVWMNSCTHCMACACYCPQEAIETGDKSIGKLRYQCEKVVKV